MMYTQKPIFMLIQLYLGHKQEVHIKRFVGDVDTWDIYRIANACDIWLVNKRYQNL